MLSNTQSTISQLIFENPCKNLTKNILIFEVHFKYFIQETSNIVQFITFLAEW